MHLTSAPHPKVSGRCVSTAVRGRPVSISFSRSLFLHHFSDDQVVELLAEFRAVARRAVLAIDLERGPLAYYFMPATRWLFGWHDISMHDGPASVQAAFKRDELASLARKGRIDESPGSDAPAVGQVVAGGAVVYGLVAIPAVGIISTCLEFFDPSCWECSARASAFPRVIHRPSNGIPRRVQIRILRRCWWKCPIPDASWHIVKDIDPGGPGAQWRWTKQQSDREDSGRHHARPEADRRFHALGRCVSSRPVQWS